jgi:glyoxylase-like metal-dependent hydrolase (beta-lactamase superfamily II)
VFLVDDDAGPVALTGDVLFAGSVGRTDFPGSDPSLMAASLARLAALDPATRGLPGHGPATTIAAEIASNPFLRTL